MRFIIKHTGVGTERISLLTGFIKSPNTVIETPNAALFTQAGSVVNLTAEVLAKVFTTPHLLWVPLSNAMHLEIGLKVQNEGIAKFAGLPEYFTCVTMHSMSEPTTPGHFEQDKMPLWTKNGKKLLNADKYMDIMELYKPDMCMVMADGHTSLNEARKRIDRSTERSLNSVKTCVERYKSSKILSPSSLIGVIVATGDNKQCKRFIEQLLTHKENLCGVSLQGLTDGSDESFQVPLETLEGIFQNIGNTIPKDLLKIIEGCWSPAVVLAAIDHGWDLFDGSYPVKLTKAGYALKLNFDIATSDEGPFYLDLNDCKYKEDFNPILENCGCLACQKHTRAYIRHLLNTREMLAGVLLSIHNLYHFDQFFYHARQHIAENTFGVYRQHITRQCNAHKLVIPIPQEKSLTPIEVSTTKNRKKKKRIEENEVSNSNLNLTSNT